MPIVFNMPDDNNSKSGNAPIFPKNLMEQEKRIRREIANGNERRRMQSINAGFESLRALLPHREGEKLSKAAILQNTAEYVLHLEQEKATLLEQNKELARKILFSPHDSDGSCSGSPLPKRKKREPADSIDEGIGSSSPSRSENGADDVKNQLTELRLQLEHEQTVRALVEQQLRKLERRLFSINCSLEASEQTHLNCHNEAEEIEKSLNAGLESGRCSPQSPISCPDIESLHEISLRVPSPPPKHLSGKSDILPHELSISNANIHRLTLSSSDVGRQSFEFDLVQKVHTPRPNLDTIVEAIRHVEGDHMFRDDPEPTQASMDSVGESDLKNVNVINEQNVTVDPVTVVKIPNIISLRHQLMGSSPLNQIRPGVIVSNLS